MQSLYINLSDVEQFRQSGFTIAHRTKELLVVVKVLKSLSHGPR